MWKDSIIEEIHKHRDEYLKQFDYDIHAICEDIRKKQGQGGRVIATPKQRPVSGCAKVA